MHSEIMQNIFNYTDYRAYLHDYYRHKKATNCYFSYRSFARLAQYKSPSFFMEIVRGKKKLTPWMAERFSLALRLSDNEKTWFLNLVEGKNETPAR